MFRWFFNGLSNCVRERRMPYGIHVLRMKFIHFIRRFISFKWHYYLSYAAYRLKRRQPLPSEAPDLVFVLKKNTLGWILDGICREVAHYFPGRHQFHYLSWSQKLPDAKAYFFAHYSFYPKCLKTNPALWGRDSVVFFTHPKELEQHERELVYALSQCKKVVCQGSASANDLMRKGVPKEKVTYVLGGADPDLFQTHERTGKGFVGFSTAFYERKSPDKILKLIQAMPHRQFILLGPGSSDAASRHRRWDSYKHFKELVSQPNLSYIETNYADYPRYYAMMDVFVSVSTLEGGPIPLIEAMMSNAVPVVSDTGFARDVVRHGENGFIFDVNAGVPEIAALVEKAFLINADVRRSVESLSWRNYSIEIQKILGYNPTYDHRAESTGEPRPNPRVVVPV